MSQYISKAVREFVEFRAKHRCEYCQCRSDIALESFEIEHITPISLEGTNHPSNLSLSCRGCNSRKSNKIKAVDPKTKRISFLFNPRQQVWKEHFEWKQDFLIVNGITAIGRTTVQALHINRIGVVNIRRLMIMGDLHPPIDTI